MKKQDIIQKIADLKNLALKNLRNKIISSATIITVLVLTVVITVMLLFPSYRLGASVKYNADLAPRTARYFIEIVDPGTLSRTFSSTTIGREIVSSEHWKLFMHTTQMMKITNMIYLLEMQSGSIVNFESFPNLFSGPVGITGLEKDTVLVTARINMASGIGIRLLSALKGSEVSLEKKTRKASQPAPGSEEPITENTYRDLFQKESIKLSNVNVTKFILQDSPVYLTIVDNFLFISDSLDAIRESLAAGTNPEKLSMRGMRGVSTAYGSLDTQKLVVYLNNRTSFAAPLLNGLSGPGGCMFIFDVQKGKNLSADIFEIKPDDAGERKGEESSSALRQGWGKITNQDMAALVFSSSRDYSEMINSVSDLNDDWKDLSDGLTEFFKAASIDRKTYFKKNGGILLALNDLELNNDMLYPSFTIGYAADGKSEGLGRAIFKTTDSGKSNYQGKEYVLYKMKTGAEGYYRPALFVSGDMSMLSSLEKDTRRIIGACNGNTPVIEDLGTFRELGNYKDAPHHIIINVEKSISALKNAFYYGALRSEEYSSKTVDRDVVPLLNTFSRYKTVHLAFGKKEGQSGKLVVGD